MTLRYAARLFARRHAVYCESAMRKKTSKPVRVKKTDKRQSNGAARLDMSHLFAYLSRMKFIGRWGLMRNTYPENIQEHSLRVAMIAHALAIIRNRLFNGSANPERTAVLALYHDANEGNYSRA